MTGTTATLEQKGAVLRLCNPGQPDLRFHAIWLRDNAQDAERPCKELEELVVLDVCIEDRRVDAQA